MIVNFDSNRAAYVFANPVNRPGKIQTEGQWRVGPVSVPTLGGFDDSTPVPHRLVIFSGVRHFRAEAGDWCAHGGFVREVDIWAKLFSRVLVVGPSSNGEPGEDAQQYGRENTEFFCLAGGVSTSGLFGKMKLAFHAPSWYYRCKCLLKADDVVMARGPDSVGFLGWLLTRGTGRPRFAKYADQWQPFKGEPLGYRMQKFLYRKPSFGGPVMIYGDKDPKRPHLVPFFPASLSEEMWREAGKETSTPFASPDVIHLLVVGRMVPMKGMGLAIRATKILQDRGLNPFLTIIGDGPGRVSLQSLAKSLGVEDRVVFRGWVGWDELSSSYRNADVFIHPSIKEGFGKVLLEAMSFSRPIVGAAVGVSRVLLAPENFGVVVEPGETGLIVDAIVRLRDDRDSAVAMGKRARERAKEFVVERLETRYRTFILESLGLGRAVEWSSGCDCRVNEDSR